MVLRGVGGLRASQGFFCSNFDKSTSERLKIPIPSPIPQGSADRPARVPPRLSPAPGTVAKFCQRRCLLTNQFRAGLNEKGLNSKLFCPDMLCQIPMNHSQQVHARFDDAYERAGHDWLSFRCVYGGGLSGGGRSF